MANNYGGYPYPWAGNNATPRDLRHQVSDISAVSSLDTSYQSNPRDSVVSLPSPIEEVDVSRVRISTSGDYDRRASFSHNHSAVPDTLRVGTPSTPTRGFNIPFRNSGPAYAPIAPTDLSPPKSSSSRPASRRFSRKKSGSLLNMPQGSIPEGDEINMNLLGSAQPIGLSRHKTAYSTVEEEDPDNPMSPTVPFDVSSFSGPSFFGPPKTEEQIKEVNRQEQAGILSGGLGAGLKPEAVISGADLLANAPPISPRTPSLSRRMSLRSPSFRRSTIINPNLARKATVRELGQIEANKRGEIIEVIVEDPEPQDEEPTVDLSSFTGVNTATNDFDQIDGLKANRKSTLAPQTEVFYPQANWKPFSMRWPYLIALVIISIILAASQEYLLHRGALYTFNTVANLSTWSYFTFKYLPTLVAVSYGVLWQITDFEVKRLEPYYQLSKEGGALAAESINVDYITFFNMLRPIRALQFKHYAVAVSSLATLVAVSLVPTLQAASIQLWPERSQRESDPSGAKEIHINPVYSRLLSILLLLIAIMGCVLLWQLERRPSGLVADVKGIAGIAAMANRSHILMDFKNMDTATPELIHQTLKTHRYSLRNSSLAPESHISLTQEEKDKYDTKIRPENPHPLMLRLVAGIPFNIGMLLFLVFVPVVLFNGTANVVTEKTPWLLTSLAICIKLAWGTLETDVRMIEPFYILSRRHAKPTVLTLDYTAMAFGWMPVRAALNGHFLVALVGLGSVLAEGLTVCMTSFVNVDGQDFVHKDGTPTGYNTTNNAMMMTMVRRATLGPPSQNGVNAGEETFLSFWLSFGLALSITVYLILISTLVYFRRRHPFLPRQPNTIASILAFIHQSKMLYDFVGTEKMNNDEMVKRLGEIGEDDGKGGRKGKTYGLGWFVGRDGGVHCGVDEEELTGPYRHGDDARKASQPWNSDWERY